MLRQRLRNRGSALSLASHVVVVALSLALIWGGATVLLLALKVEPETVQSLTGYASVYDALRDLGPADFDSTTRAITAAVGVALMLICGYLAYKMLPRPYLARRDLDLFRDERGEAVVEPRAIERLSEVTAERKAGVAAATGRYGTDELAVDVTLSRTRDLAGSLEGVRTAVREALEEHGLPVVPVNVTLAGYQRKTRRELT
jgi:hypothetical protein